MLTGGSPLEDSSPGTGGSNGIRRAVAAPPDIVGTLGCGAGVAAIGDT